MMRGVRGEEHFGYGGLLVMNGGFGQRQQIRHAAFAAVIGEDGPIAAAELGLHAGQIARGGGCGAFGIQAVVTNGHGVWHLVADGAINGLPGSWLSAAHQLVRGGDLETRDANDAQSGSARRRLRELHDAARSGRAGGLRHRPSFPDTRPPRSAKRASRFRQPRGER